eukprot:gene4098-7387_t
MELFEKFENERYKKSLEIIKKQEAILSKSTEILQQVYMNLGKIIQQSKEQEKTYKRNSIKYLNELKQLEETLKEKYKKKEKFKDVFEQIDQVEKGVQKFIKFNKQTNEDHKNLRKQFESNYNTFWEYEEKLPESQLQHLSSSCQGMRIKNSFGKFDNTEGIMSFESFFEVLYDYIPKDGETFMVLRQTSKEIQEILHKRWNILYNSIYYRFYDDCQNISTAVLDCSKINKFEKKKRYHDIIRKILKKHMIEEILFIMPENSFREGRTEFMDIFYYGVLDCSKKQSHIKTIGIANRELSPDEFIELVNTGVENILLLDCIICEDELSTVELDPIESKSLKKLCMINSDFGDFEVEKLISIGIEKTYFSSIFKTQEMIDHLKILKNVEYVWENQYNQIECVHEFKKDIEIFLHHNRVNGGWDRSNELRSYMKSLNEIILYPKVSRKLKRRKKMFIDE